MQRSIIPILTQKLQLVSSLKKFKKLMKHLVMATKDKNTTIKMGLQGWKVHFKTSMKRKRIQSSSVMMKLNTKIFTVTRGLSQTKATASQIKLIKTFGVKLKRNSKIVRSNSERKFLMTSMSSLISSKR